MTYAALSDAEWFAKVSGENGEPPVFQLPDPQVQMTTVGRHGAPVLQDAFIFYQFCREMLIEHGNGLKLSTKVMDFGVSWGRIFRFWMRDADPSNLYGVDPEERFLRYSREHIPGPNYILSNHRPPIDLPDNSLDLIYAFSVFSHLPADLADGWVKEFARILKPGGIACLTTRPRSHILQSGTAFDKSAQAGSYAQIFTDREEALAAYDAGELVYYGSGGGGGLTPDIYGEAIIPAAYAERKWGCLELIGLFDNYSDRFLQPCFVLRKR